MGIKKNLIGVAMGQGQISLDLAEQAAPSTLTNKIRLYSKDVSGVAEFFVRDDHGHEVQITRNGSAGGASLTDANIWTQKQSMPLLRITPQASAPSGVLGDLYIRDPYGLLYFHDGLAWNLVAPLSKWFEVPAYTGGPTCDTVAVSGDGTTWAVCQSMAYGYVMLTTNRGETWAPITALGESNWAAFAIGYDNLTMLASDNTGVMQMSLDGGATWNPVTPGGKSSAGWSGVAIGSDNQTMLACYHNSGIDGKIYMTTNRWSTFTELTPLGATDALWRGVAIGQDNLTILAAVSNGRVWRSTDGGATTWDDISPTGSNGYWTQPGIGPDNLTFMIGQNGGPLWKTVDGAATPWTQENPSGSLETTWSSAAAGGPTPTLLASLGDGRVYAYIDWLI